VCVWWLCAGSPRGCWKVALGGCRNRSGAAGRRVGGSDCDGRVVSVRCEGTDRQWHSE